FPIRTQSHSFRLTANGKRAEDATTRYFNDAGYARILISDVEGPAIRADYELLRVGTARQNFSHAMTAQIHNSNTIRSFVRRRKRTFVYTRPSHGRSAERNKGSQPIATELYAARTFPQRHGGY